jgi:ubiquitin-protein ligase
VEGSAFEGGIYHGIIKLPKDYPRKAPSVSLSTLSGRWKINEEICLSGTVSKSNTTCVTAYRDVVFFSFFSSSRVVEP